jgi:hypothetical protein
MNSNISAQVAKSTLVALNTISQVIPLYNFESISNFSGKLNNYIGHKTMGQPFVEGDYYQGSESDLINIFLEILDVCRFSSLTTKEYIVKRLEFLANEGLQTVYLQDAKATSFKFSKDEVVDVIVKNKKQTKIKSKRKPVKKLRRNKLGRFVKSIPIDNSDINF